MSDKKMMPGVPLEDGSVIFPRIRGNAVPKGAGWSWEMFITIGESEPIFLASNETYLNDMAAKNALRAAAKDVTDKICECLGAGKPEALLDLNKGKYVAPDKFSEPERP